MAFRKQAQSEITLRTPLSAVTGIAPRFLPKLKKLGIETVHDLLLHIPSRYLDFSNVVPIRDLAPGTDATVQGTVKIIKNLRTWKRRITLTEALIADETGTIRALWFNQPYLTNTLSAGRRVSIAGKVTKPKQGLLFSNPIFELLSGQSNNTTHTARIIPIYPETRGLTSKGIRYLVKIVFEKIRDIPEILPKAIVTEFQLPVRETAFREVHFPSSGEKTRRARERFIFEELLLLQLRHLRARMRVAREQAQSIQPQIEKTKLWLKLLPFPLMQSQKKSLWEILQDMEKEHPMTRLLQGDVGSGKTIVAALAAMNAAESGFQSAFMAPTEILARQHYETFAQFFGSFEKGVALLTANEARLRFGNDLETKPKKQTLLQEIKEGRVGIVFGTHALIQKTVSLPDCALVIIDEQHRFGVEQRAALTKQQKTEKGAPVPHLLSMSATPIPRTLNLVLFGDLDISLITELPKNRKQIETRVVDPEKRKEVYAFIRKEIKSGRQAFVICPRIAAPDVGDVSNMDELSPVEMKKLELKSVEEERKKLSEEIFPDLSVAMLHGKMKAQEKEEIMGKFKNGDIDILVSTSVVEVGIDVPNATIMMIESAERFGLAQLYQFRGRVGRGEHASFCFLLTESKSEETRGRLHLMSRAKNGFELAEQDLKLRGPGEFLGESQTGMPDTVMRALQNPHLVTKTRQAARMVLEKNPNLKNAPELKSRLAEFQKDVHWE